MLQFTASAGAKIAARRIDMMRPALNKAIGVDQIARCRSGDMLARRGDAIALGSDAQNYFVFSYRNVE
ncbi:hypothetical protein GCM10009127_21560 [Alteraurantiacibacter aestuarii]|uniref:hypothetical protein n=1 Tax=Alteraurantiacibacter aestuarii TaxID=650004 RepID=UPI0031DACF0D